MTRPSRRNLAIGGAVALVLLWLVAGRDDDPGAPAAGPAAARPGGSAAEVPVADVKLELLQQRRPELLDAQRNLFRFQVRQAPEPPPAASRSPRAAVPRPSDAPAAIVPSGPPSPPPIPIRFIGLLDVPSQAGRIAILSDGRGNVFYGKEGDIIEGRYKVLRVGPDAAELSYLDGRGRQTVRLSGQ